MATILVNGQPWEYEATSYYETEVFEHDDAKEMYEIIQKSFANLIYADSHFFILKICKVILNPA